MQERRHGERRIHLRGALKRTCADMISNQGTEERSAATYQERPCGDDAAGYCQTCAEYVCDIHWHSNHELHEVARR